VEVSLNKAQIREAAKTRVRQHIEVLRRRLAKLDLGCLNSVYTVYIQSLIIYNLTPLAACRILSKADVEKLEAFIRRRVLYLPSDVSAYQHDSQHHKLLQVANG
jgi:hypothetical protein